MLDGPAAAARFGARSGGEPAAAGPAWDRDLVTLVVMSVATVCGKCGFLKQKPPERPGPAGTGSKHTAGGY